jgi:hypothetical protein
MAKPPHNNRIAAIIAGDAKPMARSKITKFFGLVH